MLDATAQTGLTRYPGAAYDPEAALQRDGAP